MSRSTMSCRVAISPGFLSEKSSETSCTNGVGQELRSAKHPISEGDSAFRQRRSSCSSWSSCGSSLEITIQIQQQGRDEIITQTYRHSTSSSSLSRVSKAEQPPAFRKSWDQRYNRAGTNAHHQ